mgnify:CR=1 FL=1
MREGQSHSYHNMKLLQPLMLKELLLKHLFLHHALQRFLLLHLRKSVEILSDGVTVNNIASFLSSLQDELYIIYNLSLRSV